VSGSSYVKWHLPSSSAADHRGKTEVIEIKNHQVIWDYEKTISVRLTIDKSGMLQEAPVDFEIVQVYMSGSRSERIVLGHVKLNLAEYADEVDGTSRRYLMQGSKINSTLKVSRCGWHGCCIG
jgi:hypothetical protein